jgi:hypothetical protein
MTLGPAAAEYLPPAKQLLDTTSFSLKVLNFHNYAKAPIAIVRIQGYGGGINYPSLRRASFGVGLLRN